METLTNQLTGCHTTTLIQAYKILLHECNVERFGEDRTQPENNCLFYYNSSLLKTTVGLAGLLDVNLILFLKHFYKCWN